MHKQKQTHLKQVRNRHYYTIATNDDGTIALKTADETEIDASNIATSADEIVDRPENATNGATGAHGISFPTVKKMETTL